MIMTTDIAVRQTGSDLAIQGDQSFWTDKQVAALRQLGVQDASNGDLAVFFHQCQRTGLDPFAKQIYMIGRWSREGTKYTIQTGIDGFRLIARRAVDRSRETLGYRDTQWCGPDGHWVDVWLAEEPPAAARVTVLRNGAEYSAVALWREYVQTVKDKQTGEQVPNSMWQRMPASQLAKCAEALALRKAFPQDLSGIYTSDEMGQASNPAPQSAEQPAVASIQDAVRAHQAANTEPAADPEPVEEVPAADDPVDAEPLRTPAQAAQLTQLIKDNDLTADEALPMFSEWVGRPVISTKELTEDEADTIITRLTADPETGEVPAGDGWPEVAEVTR
jgi:phage recombination protein Bet